MTSANPTLIDQVRPRFPALARKVGGKPAAYFDGPGGTQVPRSVVDAMADYLLHHNANTHWNFATSQETDAALLSARQSFADFLGARPSEIVFGANMTTLTMHVARALGARMGTGDEIVVTQLDHQANVAPWKRLEAERGVKVRTVPMLVEEGTLDWGAFEALVGERTRLVAVGAASNVLGTINDVRRATRMAHAVGASSFVDAVHHAPHALIDVADLDCDLLVCSAYKFYGPHVGILFGRHELLSELDVPRLPSASNEAPERIETGTLNHEGIVGAEAAVDFLASLAPPVFEGESRRPRLERSFAELHRRGDQLATRLWSGLENLPGVRLYGPRPGTPRTSTVAFRVEGLSSARVAARLSSEHGVFVSDGDFYGPNVVEALGLPPDGLVRAGCACYTTEAEVDRLISAVASCAR